MHALLNRDDDEDVNYGSGGGDTGSFGLRVGSVFIILVGSMFGALFPVISRRTKWLAVPKPVFDFAKYFGSGVIVRLSISFVYTLADARFQIATAFIHLLDPAIEELGSPCLAPGWGEYVRFLSIYTVGSLPLLRSHSLWQTRSSVYSSFSSPSSSPSAGERPSSLPSASAMIPTATTWAARTSLMGQRAEVARS